MSGCMILLYSLLIFVVVIVLLDYSYGLKFNLSACLLSNCIIINAACEDPFCGMRIWIEESTFRIKIYLFKIRVFNVQFSMKKGNASASKEKWLRFLKAAYMEHIYVSVSYGLQDPFATGILCGALRIAAMYLPIEALRLTPDFVSNNFHMTVSAYARVSLGHTILNYFRIKS